MATILDGKKLSDEILEKLKQKISKSPTRPKIAIIIVGNNTASQIYVKVKQKRARELGIESTILEYPENISQDILEKNILNLNAEKSINAILVQLPLPLKFNTLEILSKIDVNKDVDGFHAINAGILLSGGNPLIYPCTPLGIIKLLEEYKIDIESKNAVVIGRSNIVGKPLAIMFLNKNATVTVCHSKTKNLSSITKQADILVCAVGSPKFITADMVKKGAVVIDVGVSRLYDGSLCGDVDFENVKEIASAITPNPKGIGPMTIAMLFENTYKLYSLQNSGK